ncbi:MAG TPA: DegV family protein [Acidimicrobiales bacterium]|nr:DegV family protein [Acidimicrobiales bacterium]
MSVHVVTDSAASLPPGAAERLGIVVVPMTLVLGGMVYADGDLAPFEVVDRASRESVTTSSPSPGDFLKAVASATEDEESRGQVLLLTVSSSMSATYEVARTAANYVDDAEVEVVDTRTAAGAQGLVVMAAAELARTGATLEQVTRKAQRAARNVRLMASLRSLDHLARSGRVPGAAAWAGRSLGVRAMFEFTAGGVRPRRPARSERGALERMVGAMTQSRPEGTEGRGAVLRAAVMEAQAAESADRLLGLVTGAVPTADVFEAPFSSVMIAHTGPGLVGLAWWWEASDGGSVR